MFSRSWLPFPAGRSLLVWERWGQSRVGLWCATSRSYWPQALRTLVPEHPLAVVSTHTPSAPRSFLQLGLSPPPPKPCLLFREPFSEAPSLSFSQVVYVEKHNAWSASYLGFCLCINWRSWDVQFFRPGFIKIYSQTVLVAGRKQQSSWEFKSSVSDIHTGIDPVISCLLVFKLFSFFFLQQ